MKFSYTLAAIFATAAVAAPVAQAPEVPVNAGLLAKLSPDVAALVTGLGLTSLAPGLASTLITLSEGLKTRDVSAAGVPVDAGLLAKLSPDVAALVSGLGLTTLAPGLASTLITLSEGLKARQIEGVVNTVEGVTAPVTDVVGGVVKGLGLRQAEGVVNTVEGVTAPVTDVVGGVVQDLGLRQIEPVVNTVEGVTAPVTDVVGGVVKGLGLRQVEGVVNTAEGVVAPVTNVVGGVVQDLGLRQDVPVVGDLVQQLEALLAGLTSGVNARQEVPVVGDVVAQVEALLAGLKSGVVARQELPVVGDLVKTLEGLLAGLKGVSARQEIPVVSGLPVVGDLVKTLEGLLAGLKGVAARDVAGVPVDAGLLAKLSPDVAALVSGLGLTTLAPGLASTLITLSEGLKTRQGAPDIAAELKPALEAILKQVTGAVEDKVVPAVTGTVEKVVPAVKDTVEKVVPQVTGAVEKVTGALGGVGARDVAGIPVDAGLLAKLSPDVAALVSGLGLTTIAPGLASTLITLSEGLKTRSDSPVPDIPVDAGLLAKLSPDVAALVSGLGLTSIAPGLAATLVTLSEGLKVRQLPVVGDLPVVDEVLKPVTGLVSGLAGGVVARESPVPVDAGLLAKLSPDVAALVSGLGLTSLAPGLASTLITLSGGLKARQGESSDALSALTKAIEALANPVTGVVSGLVAPLGNIGARDAPVVGGVVSEVEGVVKNVTSNVGATDAVKAAGVPVDAGLLTQLSPAIAALVSGLGLTSLAPGLASTLITLSQGL
ncbi:hypothetical protein V492_01697 [Pseudogymnoascus sp. VKM F-4246]|nr:hypothetical protein V492_01697 [Pseudogymnoascus sp. VKM F-4246]